MVNYCDKELNCHQEHELLHKYFRYLVTNEVSSTMYYYLMVPFCIDDVYLRVIIDR